MARIAVTEEMRPEVEWYAEAKKQKPDTLMKFIDHVMNDYFHDYGTVCHAIAACAIAAACAADATSQGGITGFQAGFVLWGFIRQWMYENNKCGLKLVDYDNMLYPQYREKFEKTIPNGVWEKLQEEARQLLKDDKFAAFEVKRHWESIVDGNVPFGYTVEKG